ncbi:tyrosine-protein phosphatase [Streptomyces sp. NPDC058330]|uniref:tyrosine-protein phosphatase n=1 Tax=Streptomyces sp. NPDC058330 TaxID=3346449 RepID=UPI0036E0B345
MDRLIAFDAMHNFRDLGGIRTAEGRTVRRGLVFRSDSPARLEGPEWDRFLGLGIRTVIDLRYPWEVSAKGRVPEHERLTYLNLSIEHRPYDQAAIDPAVDPWRYLADRFAEVAEDGVKEIRQVLETVAAADAPLLFHCASGKDRTGLVAALVLSLLGADEDEIARDFALTELATERLVAVWSAAHEGRRPAWPGYGRAPEEVIRLFLASLTAAHGSVHGYTTGRLGVTDGSIDALRARLLED